MKNWILFFFLVFGFRSIAQNQIRDRFQGTWEYSEVRISKELSLATFEYEPDSEFRTYIPFVQWVIRGNNIYEIDYPCCFVRRYEFEIRDTILVVNEKGEHPNQWSYLFHFSADSLILDDVVSGTRSTLLMDTLPEKEVNELINGKINPECFYGDWSIPTGEVSDSYDVVFVAYAWEMPETIHIDSTNIDEYWKNNQFFLPVNGVKQPFEVVRISLHREDFMLVPKEWSVEYFKQSNPDSNPNKLVWLHKI